MVVVAGATHNLKGCSHTVEPTREVCKEIHLQLGVILFQVVMVKVPKIAIERLFATGTGIEFVVHCVPGDIQHVPESCIVPVIPEKTFSVTIESPTGSLMWDRIPGQPIVEDHLRELERVWQGFSLHR